MRSCFHCGRPRRRTQSSLPVGFCSGRACQAARNALNAQAKAGEVDMDLLTRPWVLTTYDGEEDGRVFESRAEGMRWIRIHRPGAWSHRWRHEEEGFAQVGMDDRWASLEREG